MKQTIISFQLTEEEKEALEQVYYLEPWLQDAVDNRRRKGNKYQFKLDDEDVGDCLNALRFQTHHGLADRTRFISLAQKINRCWQLTNLLEK